MANNGASPVQLRMYGCWKSDSVAQGYVEESDVMKKRCGSMVFGSDEETPCPPPKKIKNETPQNNKLPTAFADCSFEHCSFNF